MLELPLCLQTPLQGGCLVFREISTVAALVCILPTLCAIFMQTRGRASSKILQLEKRARVLSTDQRMKIASNQRWKHSMFA